MKFREFARGKHSLIYLAEEKGKKIAKKIAINEALKKNINKEAEFLKILNKYDIGPKLLGKGDGHIIYEFIEGEFIQDWLKNASKNDKKRIAKIILEKCFLMDKLGISKEEMTHPGKHIIIGETVKMIDFERAKKTKKPQNVTQFSQYLISNNIMKANKNIFKIYKNKPNKSNFNKIISLL